MLGMGASETGGRQIRAQATFVDGWSDSAVVHVAGAYLYCTTAVSLCFDGVLKAKLLTSVKLQVSCFILSVSGNN